LHYAIRYKPKPTCSITPEKWPHLLDTNAGKCHTAEFHSSESPVLSAGQEMASRLAHDLARLLEHIQEAESLQP
jgi:hypothetical protein